MAESNLTTPQDDAERIRLKRLARLQAASASSSTSPSPGPSESAPAKPEVKPEVKSSPKPVQAPPQPAPAPKVTPKRPAEPSSAPPATSPPAKKKPQAPAAFDLASWEHETTQFVLKVTLDGSVAEKTNYDLVWLKYVADDLKSEGLGNDGPIKLNDQFYDRLLIGRLEIDPQNMTDDLEFLNVLASLPPQQTIFEYLTGCWKRLNSSRSALIKRGYTPVDTQNALSKLDKLRELLISYTGLTLQTPDMFPQPPGRNVGPVELLEPLLSLSTLSAPLYSSADTSSQTLSSTDVEPFLQELARRFEPDNELDEILAPVVKGLLWHECLASLDGVGGHDAKWRGVLSGLEALVSVKPIAVMLTRMPEWNPPDAQAHDFERKSLMGPLCRLSAFAHEWPGIVTGYYTNPDERSKDNIESAHASIRGTLKSLQGSLFQVFNTIVRASSESREAVLEYFARVITLNVKRSGTHVDMATVASDGFMMTMQCILYRFAEPFMDATYSKLDRVDPLYLFRPNKVQLPKDETRINATSQEATAWEEQYKDDSAPPPNFISHIFYLSVAMSHYGYLKTISQFDDIAKHIEDTKRSLDQYNAMRDSSAGGPMQARIDAGIQQMTMQISKLKSHQLAFEAQLQDPDLMYKSIEFTNFLSTWLIRQVDPRKQHPNPVVELPLSTEVPMSFKVLPEYIFEDIVEYLHFAVQHSPDKFELGGKNQLLMFVLTFLSSTWYIKNPFLKSKINDTLFMSLWGYGYHKHGVLGDLVNSDPSALKHLMPALMSFYVVQEVEQTGASSQFYDKFNARRNISYILKVIWNNPIHREALNSEAANLDKFVRFVNLMINDVTYLMDESLNDLTQIHSIETEMSDQAAWNAKSPDHRREREQHLRTLERHSSSFISLARSTVELLKVFTKETPLPFMMPEIVDRLAAMLDYNLNALVGPKCQELKIRDPKKLRWDPRALLSDMIQVFLNLSEQQPFIAAVAGDGRSYNKSVFDAASTIAVKRTLKTEKEIEQLQLFIVKVEEYKVTMEAEEDFGEIPDEFLDPLMFSIMRDPVVLPSSKATIDRATIKSHLLSDTTDPFNRSPLKIEDVKPDLELKARIEAFIVERRSGKMDTSS